MADNSPWCVGSDIKYFHKGSGIEGLGPNWNFRRRGAAGGLWEGTSESKTLGSDSFFLLPSLPPSVFTSLSPSSPPSLPPPPLSHCPPSCFPYKTSSAFLTQEQQNQVAPEPKTIVFFFSFNLFLLGGHGSDKKKKIEYISFKFHRSHFIFTFFRYTDIKYSLGPIYRILFFVASSFTMYGVYKALLEIRSWLHGFPFNIKALTYVWLVRQHTTLVIPSYTEQESAYLSLWSTCFVWHCSNYYDFIILL